MVTWEERMGPRPPAPLPRLEQLDIYWHVRGPNSGKVITCGLYRTDAGLEVRVGYSEEDLLRSQRVGSVEAGRELAAAWLRVAIGNGCVERPAGLTS